MKTNVQKSVYTKYVGEKFHSNGDCRYFPGATVVSFLGADNPFFQAMLEIQRIQKEQKYGSKYSYLPPSSFHMTVFEVYNDMDRYRPGWSTLLEPLSPAEEANLFFATKTSEVIMPKILNMKVSLVDVNSIKVVPADENTSKDLEECRYNLSEATGIRFPEHNTYQFHLSMAYPIIELDSDEIKLREQVNKQLTDKLCAEMGGFSLPEPVYCVFSSMATFTPWKTLQKH